MTLQRSQKILPYRSDKSRPQYTDSTTRYNFRVTDTHTQAHRQRTALGFVNIKQFYTFRLLTVTIFRSGRHQLKTAVAILTGHAPVKGCLRTMGLFNGDPSCRFCGMETETVQHITCCCESLAGQRYNVLGELFVQPKEISTASVRDLWVFIRETGLLNVCLGLHNKPHGEVLLGH